MSGPRDAYSVAEARRSKKNPALLADYARL